MMTDDDGHGHVHFARADDTGPAVTTTDNLVFVNVSESGHDDLARYPTTSVIEVSYPRYGPHTPGACGGHAGQRRVRTSSTG